MTNTEKAKAKAKLNSMLAEAIEARKNNSENERMRRWAVSGAARLACDLGAITFEDWSALDEGDAI